MRLHIGGRLAKDGWKILNIVPGPGVDFVGHAGDLSRFASASVDEIYASHVVEHLGYARELADAFKEWHRVLKPGGCARISVPDFEILCQLFVDPARDAAGRFLLMRMAFGGQMDEHDFHKVGLTEEFLSHYLRGAGFSRLEQVERFGLFEDDSETRFEGLLISLNMVAYKD